ncbi:MAG: PaaI family thioesterase [Dehalococcoidia bacterium]
MTNTTDRSDPALVARIEERTRSNNFWRMLGLEVLGAGEGWVRLRLPLRDDLLNAVGAPLHGGAIAALVDAAVGGALATMHEAAAGGTGQATLDANVSYIGAVREGAAIAEGRILRRGGTVAFGEAEIRDESGALAAKGRVTYMILRPR